MARASTPTLLSLDRFARIMGIAPPHFNGGTFGDKFPVSGCAQAWRQYNWQANDRVSREELAQAIADAEEDIANVLGYWPSPRWTYQETIHYPQHWRRDMIGTGGADARGLAKSVKTRWGKVTTAGIRAVCLVDSPAVVYSDADGDGLDETATVSCGCVYTNESEVKVYFAGHNGEPEWEIRPARSVSIASGVYTATFYAWQLINPDLWEAFPDIDGVPNIDASDSTNLVATVDVYREYNDDTVTCATFYWSGPNPSMPFCNSCGGVGCAVCSNTTQVGFFSVADADLGLIVPAPAEYSASDDDWLSTCWTLCRTPDFVKVSYLSGAIDEKWLSGRHVEPLPDKFALAIAWLATARLHRPLCSCGNVDSLVSELQRDISRTEEGKSKLVDIRLMGNPLGTKVGEVRAWQKIKDLSDNIISVGVI